MTPGTLAISGASGGLGANVVRAAVARGWRVRALVRDPARAALPPEVSVVHGDAASVRDLVACAEGCTALIHCVNVNFLDDWDRRVAELLAVAIAASQATGARLVYPGNVWVFGRGRPGDRVAEDRPFSPCSRKGAVRARGEAALAAAGIDFTVVRLPEFFGPWVTTLTGPMLRALAAHRTATWYGPGNAEIELAYLPDAAEALVAAAAHPDLARQTVHWPGHVTTPRRFLARAAELAGGGRARIWPAAAVRVGGLAVPAAREFADILHLWTHPIVLDGQRAAAVFPGLPRTELDAALRATLAWTAAHPDVRMHYG